MAQTLRSFYLRHYLAIWLCAAGVSLLLRARAFWQPHHENDELVYLSLARHMHWDLSNYTTRDDPVITRFPNSIYRAPLFHHPPLYPLILKAGDAVLGDAIMAGLLFNYVAIVLLLYFTWRWMVFLELAPAWGAVALAGVTFCPLLLGATMVLHHDAVLGAYMACGLVAYIEALERPSWSRALAAGVLLVIAFNLRYNALIYLPLLVLLPLYQVWRASGAAAPGTWLVFGVVAVLVATLGLQHFYRMLATYGTLLPSRLIVFDANAADFNPFVRAALERPAWKMAVYLVLIYPILLALVRPATFAVLRQGVRQRHWGPTFLVVFMYLLPVEFFFSYQQIRYFATVFPCLYLGLPYLLQASTQGRSLLLGLAALSLLFMITTGFERTLRPAGAIDLIPSPLLYLAPPQSPPLLYP